MVVPVTVVTGGSLLFVRKCALSISGAAVVAALFSASAFAAGDPGASACQPQQGQLTATIARTGQLGDIISQLAPINELNHQSLFNCANPTS